MADQYHEFQITGISLEVVRPIMDMANSLGNPGGINGSYDSDNGVLYIGVGGPSLSSWLTEFRSQLQSLLGRKASVDENRGRPNAMTKRCRLTTKADLNNR